MFNIKEEVKNKKLILTIDLTEKGHESKSGKSIVIASTEGNMPVGGADSGSGIQFGVNVYKKK